MANRRNMFHRLAMREKIEAMGHADAIRTLDDELQKISGLNDRLNQIANETKIQTGTTNMMALRSAQHYASKIHEQLKLIGNRIVFIEEELSQETEIMGKYLSRQKRALEKAKKQVARERNATEDQIAEDLQRTNPTAKNHR